MELIFRIQIFWFVTMVLGDAYLYDLTTKMVNTLSDENVYYLRVEEPKEYEIV